MPRFIADSKWYGWNASEGAIARTKKRLPLWAGANAILSLLCGIIPTGVTRHSWVSFAATAALVALAAEIIGIARFCRAKGPMDRRAFEGIDHFIRISCLFHMILTGVAVAAAIVSCILEWTGIMDALALIGLVGTGLLSFLVVKDYKLLPVFKMEKPD